MARDPYRIARQEHLGDILDDLATRDMLSWRWDYDYKNSRAIYWVIETGQRERKLDTKKAELLAQRLCDQLGMAWLPVPNPGGEPQRQETLRRIELLKQGLVQSETSPPDTLQPIDSMAINLSNFPELQQLLHKEPDNNRSAQIYSAARFCINIGLSDGQIKWFLIQFPSFLHKYEGRQDGERELTRVIARAREDASK